MEGGEIERLREEENFTRFDFQPWRHYWHVSFWHTLRYE